ncbi:hypothetical protein SB659_04040 [Arthrobacter sp. SIMBA_036]|uniref:hypothetical protein n=3 Tax=Bacteria TaxID=2 RepID=UPI003978A8CC
MQRRHFLAVAALVATLLTGCGLGSAQPDAAITPTKASALLRSDIESIEYPLDKYSVSTQELNLIERAGSIRIQQCMSQNGQPVDLMATFKDRTSAAERPYGIWLMASAEQFGYGRAEENLGVPELETKTPEFNHQWDSCLSKAFPSTSYGADRNALTVQLAGKAKVAAGKDPQTKGLIEQWKSCVQAHGGTFDGSDPWSPVEAHGDKETAIRVAVADVQCKVDLNFVQQMADIEASYQETLIKENEAGLLAERQKVDQTLSEATQTVTAFDGG